MRIALLFIWLFTSGLFAGQVYLTAPESGSVGYIYLDLGNLGIIHSAGDVWATEYFTGHLSEDDRVAFVEADDTGGIINYQIQGVNGLWQEGLWPFGRLDSASSFAWDGSSPWVPVPEPASGGLAATFFLFWAMSRRRGV
jgi:hypothetical protein